MEGSSAADIFKAVKECDLKNCQQIINKDGPSVLENYDEKGHTPVHWAALAGSVELMGLFVDCKGPVDLPSQSETAQHPIHWAAVNGYICVVDLLVKAGVLIDVEDQKGCTPLITAAQYGHTALCCYLIGKGAKVHVCDLEGDTALHWAAFKGYCELTHLLIYSGSNPRSTDNFGQTPLHLAVLSGNLPTVQLLCEQDGVDLESEDNNRNTPLRLAKARKSKQIISFLQSSVIHSKNLHATFNWSSWFCGRPGKSKAPILFFYGNLFLWGYPTYIFKAINFNDWRNSKNPLSRLCHTCHLVKPLRSKHCRVTNRCVSHFDHYCPYVYNDVGQRNRTHFVGFLFTMCINCLLSIYLCWNWFQVEGRSLLIGFGFLFLSIIGFISAMMTGMCLYMAATNITTNERMNAKKYLYLMDEEGKFYNPFDRGLLLNILEFIHLIPPLSEDRIKRKQINEI
ncbi:uncharacterized protein LOC143790285 isoform X3 [Ranitomeya variabilis]|uniref:uncharacterized protein LOC143790285 isoform X3 n=1 Tax=Ranitomeya variabilis TaxID=490064 RepID=UPI0040572D6E